MSAISKGIKLFFEQGKYIFFYNIFERLTFLSFYISVARYVDKDLYGLVVSIFAFTNIIASIFDLGLPFFIQRESATQNFSKKTLADIIAFKFLLILFLLPIPLIYFHNEIEYFSLIVLISAINFYHPLNQILVFFLYGREKYKQNFKSIVITRIPLFIFLIIFTMYKTDIIISLITIFLILIIQTIYLNKSVGHLHFLNSIKKINWRNISSTIKYSFPFGLGVIFAMTYDRIDVLILKYFWGNMDVAIYSVAYSLFRHTSIISTPILLQSYNYYSKIFSTKQFLDRSKIISDVTLILFLAALLILIFNLFSEWIITIIYSKRFYESAQYLRFISFGIPFVFLNNFTGVLLNSKRFESLTMLTTFLGLLINIFFNFVLIPVYKINGAVFSTLITESSIFFMQLFLLIKLKNK